MKSIMTKTEKTENKTILKESAKAIMLLISLALCYYAWLLTYGFNLLDYIK